MTPLLSARLIRPPPGFAVPLVAVLASVALLHLPPARAQGDPATEFPGDTRAGREAFESNCHGTDASGMMRMHPSLRGAVQRLSFEGVEVTIRKGRATTPPMPAFEGRLTDQQIQDVVAYIATLPLGPRNFGPIQKQEDTRRGDRMVPDPIMGGWMMLLGTLLIVALITLIVVGLLWLFRGMRSRPSISRQDTSPRQLLDERYARGELDRDEYLRRRSDLES